MAKDNERDPFRRGYLSGADIVGSEGYPKIAPTQSLPRNVISFNESGKYRDISNNWIDHFIADSQFERVYNNCDRYISRYRQALGVIGTDFSAYRNMYKWQRKNNVGKNRSIDYYLQQHGIDVIPTVSWAYIEDFEWCLDGLPIGSSVAISTNGCARNFLSRNVFIEGVREVQRRLKPSHLIICGNNIPEDILEFKNIVAYDNFSQRMHRRIKDGK
ncbi:MAG: DUF4417 domain-containing protein [Candidatus Saccharibacteria bacterium]|nr:DUF4417 domain-containing protein [Candidatus Saccharibacteria bacterium]